MTCVFNDRMISSFHVHMGAHRREGKREMRRGAKGRGRKKNASWGRLKEDRALEIHHRREKEREREGERERERERERNEMTWRGSEKSEREKLMREREREWRKRGSRAEGGSGGRRGREGRHRMREGEEISPSRMQKRGTRKEMAWKRGAPLHHASPHFVVEQMARARGDKREGERENTSLSLFFVIFFIFFILYFNFYIFIFYIYINSYLMISISKNSLKIQTIVNFLVEINLFTKIHY